jgi:hypothetical protein
MDAIVDDADPNSVIVAASDFEGLVLYITDGVSVDGAISSFSSVEYNLNQRVKS